METTDETILKNIEKTLDVLSNVTNWIVGALLVTAFEHHSPGQD